MHNTPDKPLIQAQMVGFLLGIKMTECTKCRQTREKAKTVAKMASEALSKPQMVFKARDRLRVCEACSEIVRFYEFMKNTQAPVTVKDKCSHKSGFIVDYVSIEDVSCPKGRW